MRLKWTLPSQRPPVGIFKLEINVKSVFVGANNQQGEVIQVKFEGPNAQEMGWDILLEGHTLPKIEYKSILSDFKLKYKLNNFMFYTT